MTYHIQDQSKLIESEKRESEKIKSEIIEQMMSDIMSRGALSATDQQVAPLNTTAGPIKNQCRRLHDTKINHAGSNTQQDMVDRIMFKVRLYDLK